MNKTILNQLELHYYLFQMNNGELNVVIDISTALSSIQSGPQKLWEMDNHFLRVVVLLQESTGQYQSNSREDEVQLIAISVIIVCDRDTLLYYMVFMYNLLPLIFHSIIIRWYLTGSSTIQCEVC